MSKNKKNKQQGDGLASTITPATHVDVITEEYVITTEKVLVRGTNDKMFSMSPNKTYLVTAEMAKILIAKGAAVKVETTKKEEE